MPKLEFASVSSIEFKATENKMVATGTSSRGKPAEASFPISVFARMAAEALRAARVQEREAAGERETRGQWAQVVPIDVRTGDVGKFEMETPPAVALVFDRGMATEQAFRLTAELAESLGQRLIAAAQQSNMQSPSRN